MIDRGFKVKRNYDISSIDALRGLAVDLSAQLRSGVTVGLRGDLGAGKTTFVAQLADVLGIKDAVTSPSFVLQHEYQSQNFKIEHWDLYRLNALPEELMEPIPLGVVRLIEWYDKFPEIKKQCQFQLTFKLVFDENAESILRREVSLEDLDS